MSEVIKFISSSQFSDADPEVKTKLLNHLANKLNSGTAQKTNMNREVPYPYNTDSSSGKNVHMSNLSMMDTDSLSISDLSNDSNNNFQTMNDNSSEILTKAYEQKSKSPTSMVHSPVLTSFKPIQPVQDNVQQQGNVPTVPLTILVPANFCSATLGTTCVIPFNLPTASPQQFCQGNIIQTVPQSPQTSFAVTSNSSISFIQAPSFIQSAHPQTKVVDHSNISPQNKVYTFNPTVVSECNRSSTHTRAASERPKSAATVSFTAALNSPERSATVPSTLTLNSPERSATVPSTLTLNSPERSATVPSTLTLNSPERSNTAPFTTRLISPERSATGLFTTTPNSPERSKTTEFTTTLSSPERSATEPFIATHSSSERYATGLFTTLNSPERCSTAPFATTLNSPERFEESSKLHLTLTRKAPKLKTIKKLNEVSLNHVTGNPETVHESVRGGNQNYPQSIQSKFAFRKSDNHPDNHKVEHFNLSKKTIHIENGAFSDINKISVQHDNRSSAFNRNHSNICDNAPDMWRPWNAQI
jgi:hypothetical protein